MYPVIAHLEDAEKRFKAVIGTAAYYVYAEKFGFWKAKEKEEIVKFRHDDIALLIV